MKDSEMFWLWIIALVAVSSLFAQLFGHTGATAIFCGLVVCMAVLTRYALTAARFEGKAGHSLRSDAAACTVRDLALAMYHRQTNTSDVLFSYRGMRWRVLVCVLESEPDTCRPEESEDPTREDVL
jgi:hypothetical protein